MKIESIKLKNGCDIPIGKFSVLVGPNNVGKSQTLKDLYNIFYKGKMAKPILIDRIEFEPLPTFESYFEGLDVRDSVNNVGHKTIKGMSANLIEGESFEVYLPGLISSYEGAEGITAFFGNIAKFKISYLDASTRLRVAQKTNSFNPHTAFPQNLLQAVYGDANTEEMLQKAFFEIFSNQIKLDYSGLTEFSFRVAKDFGEVPKDPRDAFEIMSSHFMLDEQGDGYKSFVGVVLSLLLSKNRIVLLDEPEAFLHPAQARQLGFWIAEHSKSVPGQIIIATHNSNFLAGILSSTQEVNLFRLNRNGDNTNFNLMSAEETISLVKSPVLSSQRVLEAIFHRGVVVCEADADRAIYQTVAARELNSQEFLFIHAHNKQTISTVTTLLKNASIPVCAIADLDVVNDDCLNEIIDSIGGPADRESIIINQKEIIKAVESTEETQALESIKDKIQEFYQQLSRGEHRLSGARGALNRLRKEASNWTTVKSEGVNGVPVEVREKLINVIEACKLNHLFIVPVGEVEKWIDLGISQKNKWIVPALNLLYDDKCPVALRDFVQEVILDLSNR